MKETNMIVKDLISSDKVLYQYVRKSRRKPPIGIVVGIIVYNDNDFGDILVGWSLCRKDDVFDRKMGKDIAIGRAIRSNYDLNVPQSCKKVFDKMHDRLIAIRTSRFFKKAG